MVDDAPYRLAYEASLHAIEDQANVIESLRSRAGTVFAATALVTSFLGGFAFRDERELDLSLWSLPSLAVALFVVLAILTLTILWPFRFRFSVSAKEMLAIVEASEAVDPVTEQRRTGRSPCVMRPCTTQMRAGYAVSSGASEPLSFVSSERLGYGSSFWSEHREAGVRQPS
jgi:hypothetical protein